MLRHPFTRTLLVLCTFLPLACQAANDQDTREALLLKTASDWQKTNHITGLSFAVVNNDGWQFVSHIGHHEQDKTTLVTDNSQFWIGSNTKILTALLAMQLVQEGKLDLNQPITTYLPELAAQPALKPILLKHLLTHQAGLVRDYLSAGESNAPMSWLVRELANDPSPLKYAPGSFTSYSNVGYALLGVILERSEQKPYAQIVQERLFTPLAMSHSLTLDAEQATPRTLTTGYIQKQPQSNQMRNPGVADGSVISTAQDMAKLSQALLALEQGQAGIISLDSWQAMQEVVTNGLHALAVSRHGLGWIRQRVPHLGDLLLHGGSVSGFTSSWMISKDHQTAVVVLTNDSQDSDDLALQLLSIASLGNAVDIQTREPQTTPAGAWVAGDYGFVDLIRIHQSGLTPSVSIGKHNLKMRANEFGRYKLTTRFWPQLTAIDDLLPLSLNNRDYIAVSNGREQMILAEKLAEPANWQAWLGEYQILINHSWQVRTANADNHLVPERITIEQRDGRYFFVSQDSQFKIDGEAVDSLLLQPVNETRARLYIGQSIGPLMAQDWLLAEQHGSGARLRLGNLLYEKMRY